MSERVKPPLPTLTHASARELRESQTDAEQRIWFHLRGSRLERFKFRRQHVMPPYVLDFFCASAKLSVELDGSQHSDVVDAPRTEFLRRQGIEILRFWDNDVLNDTTGVLEKILTSLRDRTLTPAPPPGGRGEKVRSVP